MIYFLIPVYNEEENIQRLYNDTVKYMKDNRSEDFHFIFVDDGSTDNSLQLLHEFFKKEGITTVLSHSPNAGVRQTFLEGFEKFLDIAVPEDILVTKEADNTSDNKILHEMINAVSDEGYDIALASCYAKGGGLESTNLLRLTLSTCANLLIKIRFRLWGISTFSSFYRCFSYSCLDKALSQEQKIMTHDGFCCVVEMLIKLKRMNFKIKEIPMILRSSERVGKSKMPILKTIKGYIKLSFSKV